MAATPCLQNILRANSKVESGLYLLIGYVNCQKALRDSLGNPATAPQNTLFFKAQSIPVCLLYPDALSLSLLPLCLQTMLTVIQREQRVNNPNKVPPHQDLGVFICKTQIVWTVPYCSW